MFILKWVGSHEHIIIFRKPLLLPQTCIYATHFKAALRNSFTKLEDCERVWIVEIIRSNYALWALSSEGGNTDQPTAALYNGPAPHHRIEDRRLEGIPIHKIIKLIPNINEIKMKPLHNGFKSQCQFHEICSVKGKVWVHPYLCQSDTVEVTAWRRRCWIPDTTTPLILDMDGRAASGDAGQWWHGVREVWSVDTSLIVFETRSRSRQGSSINYRVSSAASTGPRLDNGVSI